MENWTIERCGTEAEGARRRAPVSTLLMSTEQLLAVLEEPLAVSAPAPAAVRAVDLDAERRARRPDPPLAAEWTATPPPRLTPPAMPAAQRPGPVAPLERVSLSRRLQCARHGHDPRPHRPRPHDEVVYRCLRCGRPMHPTPPPGSRPIR